MNICLIISVHRGISFPLLLNFSIGVFWVFIGIASSGFKGSDAKTTLIAETLNITYISKTDISFNICSTNYSMSSFFTGTKIQYYYP
jgi:hypothetical protein